MKVVLVCLTLVGLAVAELPSYIKPCSRNDRDNIDKCFVESANEAIKTFAKGDDKLKTPAVVPAFKFPGTKFEPNDEFFFQMKESELIGLDSFKILDAKVDLDHQTIWFKFKYDVVEWKGAYVAKALKEKDQVEDKAHFMFTDNQYNLNMKLSTELERGTNNLRLSLANLTIELDGKPKIEYHLDNLDKHPAIKALWEKNLEGFEKLSLESRRRFFTFIFEQVFKAATYDEIFPGTGFPAVINLGK